MTEEEEQKEYEKTFDGLVEYINNLDQPASFVVPALLSVFIVSARSIGMPKEALIEWVTHTAQWEEE